MDFLDEKILTAEDLEDEIFYLKEEIRQLNAQIAEYKASEKKSAERLLRADREADELNKTAAYKYLIELKGLKLLKDKFDSLYKDELDGQKKAINDLLTDFFKDIDLKTDKLDGKKEAEKLGDKLGVKAVDDKKDEYEEDEFFFDLDEAINPSTPLDLEELCKELGVFSGEDR